MPTSKRHPRATARRDDDRRDRRPGSRRDRRPDPDRGVRALLRRPAAPHGGNRIAIGYLATFLASVIGAPLAWAITDGLYRGGAICAGSDAFACPALSWFVALGAVVVVLLAVAAWWFRLGALWVACSVALALLVAMIVGDPFTPWLLVLVLVPLGAALLSDRAQRPWWRFWLTIGGCVIVVAVFVGVIVSVLSEP